jgi:hypothetical protein
MMTVVGAPAHWHRAGSDRPGPCQSRKALTEVVPLRISRIPPRSAAFELTAAGAFGRVACGWGFGPRLIARWGIAVDTGWLLNGKVWVGGWVAGGWVGG